MSSSLWVRTLYPIKRPFISSRVFFTGVQNTWSAVALKLMEYTSRGVAAGTETSNRVHCIDKFWMGHDNNQSLKTVYFSFASTPPPPQDNQSSEVPLKCLQEIHHHKKMLLIFMTIEIHFVITSHIFLPGAHKCVCVCVCAVLYKYSYYLPGDNGRLHYLRFCLLKCMLMRFLSWVVSTAQWA